MKVLETHIVPAMKEKIRLQEYAVSIFSSITTKSAIKKAIKREEILLNGVPANTSDWIEEHQKIELLQPDLPAKKIFSLKLNVLFEDEVLAVIDKPAGIPTSGNYFRTIENALPFNLAPSPALDVLPYPLPVHRLDNPTAGLLLIAKTRNAQTFLNRAFQNKEIQKTYTAIVEGLHPEDAVYKDKIENKEALSEVVLLKKIKKENKDFSLVEVTPQTGRTHQIRIHLSKNGFPIVGDKEYGGSTDFPGGLFLFSSGVKFVHPASGEKLEIQVPLPNKFRNF